MPALPGNVVFVSRRQEGNPLLRHIGAVRWDFADVVPDFVLSQGVCALFISLRYHVLNPQYLRFRIIQLQHSFRLRVVLCQVDAEDVVKAISEVNKICAMAECTLVCVWSPEEAARYIEAFNLYEVKAPDVIKERVDHDYMSQFSGALTSIRGLNRSDATTFSTHFESLGKLLRSEELRLASCPGIGPTKVKRLHRALHSPFKQSLDTTKGVAPVGTHLPH